jgi:hypothetical protein
MARVKQTSKRKRSRTALPVWGAAGVSLAMAGSASAAVEPTPNAPSHRTASPPVINLLEEELSDVSLSTFFIYDRENTAAPRGEQYAQRGCRGCRGCAVARCGGARCAVARCAGRCGGGCAVVRRCGGCAVVTCAIACARCSCSCCLSWGSCQLC